MTPLADVVSQQELFPISAEREVHAEPAAVNSVAISADVVSPVVDTVGNSAVDV